MSFEETFQVSWSHLDGNGHMANTAYMLIAIDCRFHYFASRVTSLGGWFDLAARKLVAPPPALAEAMSAIERTANFEALPSSLR